MIPLGVAWAGYLLIWYGFCTIKGEGIGLTDLIKPSGVVKVNGFLGGLNSAAADQVSKSKPGPLNDAGGDLGNINRPGATAVPKL